MTIHRLKLPLLVVGAVSVAACSSPEAGAERLEKLSEGIPRDSMFVLIGEGPLTASGADTMRVDHGFRVTRHLVDGKMYDVVYVRDVPGDVSERVLQERETPIVVADGKVMGWGWKFYVETGIQKLRLPTPLVEEVPPAPAPGAPAPATPAPAAPAPGASSGGKS
jgi:hypothetical protein